MMDHVCHTEIFLKKKIQKTEKKGGERKKERRRKN